MNVHMETGKKETDVEDSSKPFKVAEIAKGVNDEICPDRDFNQEEIDHFEAARDRMMDKALVCPVRFTKVEKDVIEQEIIHKFEDIGVTVRGIETRRSYSGEF